MCISSCITITILSRHLVPSRLHLLDALTCNLFANTAHFFDFKPPPYAPAFSRHSLTQPPLYATCMLTAPPVTCLIILPSHIHSHCCPLHNTPFLFLYAHNTCILFLFLLCLSRIPLVSPTHHLTPFRTHTHFL